MTPLKSHELLSHRSSRLIVVDVQEKFVGTLAKEVQDRLIEACAFLCEGARIFDVPVTMTEQYPERMGPTVPALTRFAESRPAKKRFSGVECTGWPPAAEVTDDRFQIVVAGMESHVCIVQTVHDLLALGYQTFVVADAIAGRGETNHDIALQRMANAGATLITAESVLFEWCETSEAAQFKQVSSLVKNKSF